MAKLQQMSLDELISLRRAERDTTNELAKTQRRLQRLSRTMGWSPETKRAIEQIASKQHAARGDGGAAGKARERDNEQHESSDNSDDDGTSESEDGGSEEDEERELQAHEDAEAERAEMLLRERMEVERMALKARPKTRPPTTKPEPAPSHTTLRADAKFTTTEVERYSFEPTRDEIGTTFVDALQHAGGKHHLLDQWTRLLDKSEAEATAIIATRPDLQEADAVMSSYLSQLVTGDTDEGKLFATQERKLFRIDKARSRSGIALAKRISSYGALTTLKESTEYLKEKVKEHTLKPGMSKATVKVHLDAVVTAHAELTPRFASAIDLPQLLLDCVPESIGMDAAGSYKDRLSVELDEHHAYHGEDKYTIDQLRDGIAVRVSSAKAAAPRQPSLRTFPMERAEDTNAMVAGTRNPNDDDGARAKRFDGKRVKGTAGKPIQGRGSPAANGRPELEGTWFCFIKSEEAGDIFCHSNDIASGKLSEGCEVDFKIVYDKRKGKDKAADVRVRASTAAVATESDEGEEEYDASTHY